MGSAVVQGGLSVANKMQKQQTEGNVRGLWGAIGWGVRGKERIGGFARKSPRASLTQDGFIYQGVRLTSKTFQKQSHVESERQRIH